MGAAIALIRAAECWSRQHGAVSLEALCLNAPAKAVCWNAGFALRNSWTGRLPLLPAFFRMELAESEMSNICEGLKETHCIILANVFGAIRTIKSIKFKSMTLVLSFCIGFNFVQGRIGC